MFNKKLTFILFLHLSLSSTLCAAETTKDTIFQYPFYLGAMVGYGSSTWQGLVPPKKHQNLAISMSTPIRVNEGGRVWGFFFGHEFTPFFALEASYMRFPDARVSFDPMSIFSFENNDLTEFVTKTETVNLMGKIMLHVPATKMRVYSSAGVASLHRDDMLMNLWRFSPTFGAGLNYRFTDHFMGEFGGNYTAGYGESQLNPTDSYFPFLYSITLRLAYCF